MPSSKPSVPTHLSIFVTDPDSGRPAMYLPLYAEVAASRIMPADIRFSDLIHTAFEEVDPEAWRLHDRITQAAMQALGETIDASSRDALREDPEMVFDLFYSVFKDILDTTQQEHIADIRPADLKPLIIGALRRRAEEFGLVLEPENTEAIWANPLGVLTTDHVGYASFDLKRLHPDVYQLLVEAIDIRRNDPNAILKLAIWAYPYGYEGRFDALSQARFAFDAIVARLPMRWHTLPPALINMGPRALQNPSLTDWRLSPASFSASPKTLVGEDGCEQLLPANLALQEFVLRQVVRVTGDPPDGVDIPDGYKFAYVDDYKVSWFSLGHSLGEILYSLPLAPAESVKLAVIDWSWDNLTTRDEQTRLTEDVLHQTHRDRTITETVKAGLKEFQQGSSFMWGTGNAAGFSVGANIGVVGLGGAAGNTLSLGGSTAKSGGSRELAAENIQRLSDSFSQASSAQRELNSTVVIQARQEEKESIQTRTFTNYNHSHTMTILYYEVLRHFRVTVEWVRRRSAVLVETSKGVFDRELFVDTVRKHNQILRAELLDQKYAEGFNAFDRIAWREARTDLLEGAPIPTPQEPHFRFFTFDMKTGGLVLEPGQGIQVYAEVWPAGNKLNGGNLINPPGLFSQVNVNNSFTGQVDEPIPWQKIDQFRLTLNIIEQRSGDDLSFQQIKITGIDVDGNEVVLVDEDYAARGGDLILGNSATLSFPTRRPQPLPKPTTPPEEVDDYVKRGELRKHLQDHTYFYSSAIQFGQSPEDRVQELQDKKWGVGELLLDHIDPTPLESFGNYVAYPLAKGAATNDTLIVDIAAALNGNDPARRQWAVTELAKMNQHERELVELASTKSERLITLPTRGVFAEGKLGHCNVSEEIEFDRERFWKWEEHPIPFEAPGINPVTPIQPLPQQISATPTAFPQSLVNIVNPSPAPDPAGLSAALSLLATPNIFRDMSGRQEVADLLKKLTEEAVDIAEVANKAREIQAKYGTDLDKQQKDYDLGVYKTTADVAGKTVNAEVRHSEAQAAKAEAEAKKANVEAGVQQAEAAKYFPKPMRESIQQAGANTVVGNPVKEKVVVFKALGFNGQALEGFFGLGVRDVRGQQNVVDEPKVTAYFDRAVTFKSPEPVIEARVSRKETVPIKFGDEILYLPGIDSLPPKESYTVGKSHNIINVTLQQGSSDVQFKATSTNNAVDELMNKWGLELGVDKVVAAKLITEYETKNSITHGNAEEKSYTLKLPTQDYDLKISSKV